MAGDTEAKGKVGLSGAFPGTLTLKNNIRGWLEAVALHGLSGLP